MKILSFLLTSLALGMLLQAQTPPPDGLLSPEVKADRTATFRVRAPKATTVTLYGDWMPVGQPQPMTRDAEGVWALTTEPLEATVHLYWFNLDGLALADPVNPVIKLRQRTSASLVEIPAATPAPWEVHDVPHGTVVTEWHRSEVLQRTERVVVYLPPGYEGGAKRYPILYLLHGSGDVPESWVQAGHANLILDNLIAGGQARPMIVVMPAGHALPFAASRTRGVANFELFERYLVGEVLPLVEGKYRVTADLAHRAVAGFSMGGSSTILVGFDHPGLFSVIGSFSPGMSPEFEARVATALREPKALTGPARLLWISCGDQDNTVQYPRVKAWTASLEQTGLHPVFRTLPGAHTWAICRTSLAEFAPLLFPADK